MPPVVDDEMSTSVDNSGGDNLFYKMAAGECDRHFHGERTMYRYYNIITTNFTTFTILKANCLHIVIPIDVMKGKDIFFF